MKKICLVLLLGALVALPVMANATLINLGFNAIRYSKDYSERGIGPVFTFLTGRTNGFYAQLAPCYFTSWKWFGTVFKYSDSDFKGGGLNFNLGFGHDFNFGEVGVIAGGGLFATGCVWYDTYWEDLYYETAAGPGGGAHVYFKPSEGRLILNAGLDIGWRPFGVYGNTYSGFDGFSFDKGYFNININAGIGFRR